MIKNITNFTFLSFNICGGSVSPDHNPSIIKSDYFVSLLQYLIFTGMQSSRKSCGKFQIFRRSLKTEVRFMMPVEHCIRFIYSMSIKRAILLF